MNWIKVLTKEELPEGTRKVVKVEGKDVLFLWQDNKIHAMNNKCPHLGMSLQKGKITADNALVCPWHKSGFDLCTGAVKAWSPWPPGIGKLLGCLKKEATLKIYPTKMENGEIFIQM